MENIIEGNVTLKNFPKNLEHFKKGTISKDKNTQQFILGKSGKTVMVGVGNGGGLFLTREQFDCEN